MRVWQGDILSAFDDDLDEREIFTRIAGVARDLGFERCAYGIRVPVPVTRPQVHTLSNYPDEWKARYEEARYVLTDPTVAHAARSQKLLLWSDEVFSTASQLWSEARSHGLRFGVAQSSHDWHGVSGMLTLARADEVVSPTELRSNAAKVAWLVHTAHAALSRRLVPRVAGQPDPLTSREVEVLRWTADGKTAGEISEILHVSEYTVTFHIGNAVRKLGTTNKIAAVVKAAILGLL